MAKQRPLRINLLYRGANRKFLAAFAGRDNSIYFHPYRPPGQQWMAPPMPSAPEPDLRIHFPSYEASSFALHKVSFHPTGFIHLTDSNGHRYRSGTRGPSFDTMALPYDLAVFAPCEPLLLPEGRGRGFNVDINLQDPLRPFYMTFSLIAASAPPAPVDGPFFRQPLSFIFPGHAFGLGLTMWPVRQAPGAPPPGWPPFPLFLLRTAA